MAEELRIQITARDGASQVFKAVADSAKKVSDELEDAGRQGEQGLDKVERGARDATREVDKIGDSAKRASLSFRDFDFAITAIGAGLTYAGNAALDQTQTIIGLRAAYGDAAEEMLDFADQMANVTIFNDDDILRGERYFATLRNNYDLTISEVQQLMQVTADLASAYGTSFEDASSRITAAIRGEGEAAEYLGLTMNQQAIDRENLTLTMTNQEAAQFRLNALYEQTGVYQGTAAALAESEVGTRARLTNAIQDNAQAMANFAGPLVTQAAGLGLASTGIASMVGALGKLGPAVRNSTRVMNTLAFAFNPVTLGIAAVAAGAVYLINDLRDVGRAARELDESLVGLTDTLEQLRLSGETAASERLTQTITQIEGIKAVIEATDLAQLNQLLGTEFENAIAFDTSAVKDDLQRVVEITDDVNRQITANLAELTSEQKSIYLDWINELLAGAVTTAEDSNLDDILEQILLTPASQVPGVMEEATGSVVSFMATLHEVAASAGTSAQGIDTLSEAIDFLKAGLADGTVDLEEFMQVRADLNRAIVDGSITEERAAEILIEYAESERTAAAEAERLAEAGSAATSVIDTLTTSLEAGAESLNAAGAAAGVFASDMATAADAAEQATEAMGQAFGDETAQRITEIAEATREWVDALLDVSRSGDFLSQLNLTQYATEASLMADGLNDAAAALDDTYRVVVGNTNAIGSQVDAIQTWADELINVAGEYGKIDDLLADGLITQQQYNAAQQAYNEIASSNADIQNYILEIQTNQAPLIAEQTAALEDQLEVIANMTDAQEQLAALGWMDGDMQGRVQQVLEMADALENLGPAGEQAFAQMIDGIIATDPVLTAMLEDIGLIEEQLDGSYSINLDAAGAVSDIERLTNSIDALNETLGGTPPTYDMEVSGWEDLDLATKSIEELTALSAQDILVDIATRLTTPDGAMDPVADLRAAVESDPIEVPVVLVAPQAAGSAAGSALADLAGGGGWGDIEVAITQVGADETEAAINRVTEAAAAVDGTTATVSVTADVEAAVGAITAMAGYEGVNLATAMVSVDGDTTGAVSAVTAMSGYEGVEIATAIVGIDGDNSDAIATITATSGYEGVTIATAWVMVAGDNSDAVATINATAGYDGMTIATAYVDIVSRNRTSLSAARHGGIPGYASGGVLFEAGEAGPELAYFAGGGVALLGSHGLYSAPEGTYISPNNALNGVNVGGTTVNVTVQGDVYGIPDLTERVMREMAPALEAATRQQARSMGGRSW